MADPLETMPPQDNGAAPAAEAPAPDGLQAEVQAMRLLLEQACARLGKVESAVEQSAKQVSFLPPQVRNLGGKVDSLATAITEPRLRALLLGLLGIYDLIEQMQRASEPTDHGRNYQTLRTQLGQLLAGNGLVEIVAAGEFNPEQHRALQKVKCSDPAQANRIVEVVRAGFRTDQAVLRYAEVTVGQYVPEERSE